MQTQVFRIDGRISMDSMHRTLKYPSVWQTAQLDKLHSMDQFFHVLGGFPKSSPVRDWIRQCYHSWVLDVSWEVLGSQALSPQEQTDFSHGMGECPDFSHEPPPEANNNLSEAKQMLLLYELLSLRHSVIATGNEGRTSSRLLLWQHLTMLKPQSNPL
jgi:hypothetical protein